MSSHDYQITEKKTKLSSIRVQLKEIHNNIIIYRMSEHRLYGKWYKLRQNGLFF